jgi:hypothetical protein
MDIPHKICLLLMNSVVFQPNDGKSRLENSKSSGDFNKDGGKSHAFTLLLVSKKFIEKEKSSGQKLHQTKGRDPDAHS